MPALLAKLIPALLVVGILLAIFYYVPRARQLASKLTAGSRQDRTTLLFILIVSGALIAALLSMMFSTM